MKTVDFLINLLYPPTCIGCGELLLPDCELPFCEACGERWIALKEEVCPQCRQRQTDCRCLSPLLIDLRCEGLHLVPYTRDTVAGKALLLAKEERLPFLIRFWANELEEAIQARRSFSNREKMMITYLPRSRSRAAVTGVDPSASLARAIASRLDIPMLSLFARRRAPLQKQLTAEERLRSARRTYRLKKKIPDLNEMTVILIDDILTTGATMTVGAELLRSRGVKKVWCVTVGMTPIPSKISKKSEKI